MKLNSQTYDIIKWIVQAVLPALITAIGTIGIAVGWEHTEVTMTVLAAITGFLAASLGISSAKYYKDETDI